MSRPSKGNVASNRTAIMRHVVGLCHARRLVVLVVLSMVAFGLPVIAPGRLRSPAVGVLSWGFVGFLGRCEGVRDG
jgi:hypothetical protein